MARVPIESFTEKEVRRVYLAASVREAKKVEALLEDEGVEYAIEVEAYYRPILGLVPREHKGAAFYVLGGQAGFCRDLLGRAGLRSGIVPEESA